MEGVGRAGEEELLDPDGETVQRAEELLSSGGLPEGLASLAADCLTALRTGTEEAAVLDGRREHALLLYLLDQPIPGLIVTAAQG